MAGSLVHTNPWSPQVDRSTNFQVVYALPNGYQEDLVIDALVRWVQTTPADV